MTLKRLKKLAKAEAEVSSSHTAVLRPKESAKALTFNIREGFKGTGTQSKYKCVLIQEGMGNFANAFYYPKEVLKASASLFEGKKLYANHPSESDEINRPERDVRDILGFFENCIYEEKDGRGSIVADVIVPNGAAFDWARSLMHEAVSWVDAKKPIDFVGLSINASGTADAKPIEEILKIAPLQAREKLTKAQLEGVKEVRVVTALTDAVSCDLVTEAGAGGKLLAILENKKERKMEKKEGMKQADEQHGDEQQDIALFKKLIAQYLGDKAVDDGEAVEMAKEAYEAYKELGMQDEQAYEAAGKHLQVAMKMADKVAKEEPKAEEKPEEKPEDKEEPKTKEAKEEEACEKKEAEEKKEEEKAKESLLMKLKAENVSLKERLAKIDVDSHLEKVLKESGHPMRVTKAFRETLGAPKSKEHIETMWKLFEAGLKTSGEAVVEGSGFAFAVEKQIIAESNKKGESISFADCVKE